MCWGQENIVESAMQKLRDHEARDSSSKSMGDWKIFEALLNSDLLSRFGADAIEPTTTIPQPAGARINKGDRFLFQRHGETATHDKIKGIMNIQD